MKKFVALILALLLLTANVALAEGTLTMGTNAEWPPFEYVEGDEVVGLDVDIAMEIAKDLGLTLVVENMAFDSVIPSLTSGQIDVGLSGMSITEERLLTIDFSDSYYNAKQVCIVKEGGVVVDSETLKNAKIGVQNGTTGDFAAEEYSEDIERYSKALDAVLELKGGKLDAVVVDQPVALNILAALNDPSLIILENVEFEDEFYGIAVAKGNPELLESINATLARIWEDGTMDALLAKYFSSEDAAE